VSIAYVNGRYVDKAWASVSIEDRGYQFSDGVYEVIAVHNGALIDGDGHFERLFRSLGGLNISIPWSEKILRIVMGEVIRRNRLRNGSIYLQITRGAATRNHAFPQLGTRPSLVVTATASRGLSGATPRGVGVITVPENRWGRPDIKSVSLLPNVLAKEEAVRAGCFEAWFINDAGDVTEGSSSNCWIVDEAGKVITRPLGQDILGGITRARVMELARNNNIRIEERVFSREEAVGAAEAFVTSTTAAVMPVVAIDGERIGDGEPGPVTTRLWTLYREYLEDVSHGGE